MTPLQAALWVKLRVSRHTVASIRHQSRLKVSVISVAVVLLWAGAFIAFYAGLRWLQQFGLDPSGGGLNLGKLLMGSLLSVLTLALFLMLMFSNVLIAFSTFYRTREMAFLIQSPLPLHSLFIARLAECIAFSSWASAYLGSPLILAYGLVTEASPALYLAAVLVFLPFVVIPAALGTMLTMFLARLFPVVKKWVLIALAACAVAGVFFYLRDKLLAGDESAERILTLVFGAASRTQSPFLPSHWAAQAILTAASGDYSRSAFDLLLLLSNALFFSWLAMQAAEILFYPGWSALKGLEHQRFRPLDRGLLGGLERLLRALPNPARSLIIKDVKLFWRDPTQWSQFLIFFGIMAVYVANLRNRSAMLDAEAYRTFIVSLNLGACSLITATLTSRFVYPLVSLEGQRFWLLGLAPFTFRQLIWQKYWMCAATTALFSTVIVTLSCIILRMEPLPFFLSMYSMTLVNLGLAGMSVGLGSLYPNFNEDNPARIVSGMGGTLNFLLSIAYITLVVAGQTFMLQWKRFSGAGGSMSYWGAFAAVVGFTAVLTAAATLVPMRLGLRNLEQMEF
ncbi:MAG: putative ABC transporter permease subunit [Candidatus Hydrogenedentales bacterium]|jgi:ABC-2 type transport system permease protein